jgi:Leucine-rich repeat (LRR) protein
MTSDYYYTVGTIAFCFALGMAGAKYTEPVTYRPRSKKDPLRNFSRLSKAQKRKITTVDLSNMGLSELPDDLFLGFDNLDTILLAFNNFAEIPHAVFKVPTLKKLDISNNLLRRIDRDIGNLTNLKTLMIGSYRREAPSEIICPSVTTINLWVNTLDKDVFEVLIKKCTGKEPSELRRF